MLRYLLLTFAAILAFGCSRKGATDKSDSSEPNDLGYSACVVGYRFALPDGGDSSIPRESGFSLINQDGTLDIEKLERLKVKEAALSEAQINLLEGAVYGDNSIVSAAACYEPHHIFVFYDDSGQPSKVVEICFSCYNLRASPELNEDQWRRHDFKALARLCNQIGIGLTTGTADDFIRMMDERESH